MRSRERFLSHWKGRLLHSGIHILSHLRLLLRWVFYSVLMGVLVGFIGIAFVYAIQWVTTFRTGHRTKDSSPKRKNYLIFRNISQKLDKFI